MTDDPHRPRYHFMPPADWMNDPNGPIAWKGEYHLFYQHNPVAATWGTMHWGHAKSRDLVHWEHLPIALSPTPGGPDKDGCWSGCAVDDNGVPTLVYTGVQPEAQCVATSDDGLLTWTKHPANPVLAGPPAGLAVTGFRDPCVWREGGEWRMLIGSGLKDMGGTALLYRSPDLVRWEYMNPLCVGNQAETGTMWECPDFFPLGGKHVLLISPIPLAKTIYFVGEYRGGQFHPESQGSLDDGGHHYAAKSFLDAKGRRIVWGWLWEGRSEAAQKAAGWAGVMSLPRVLTLRSDNTLEITPAPELRALRGEPLQSIEGASLEIEASIDMPAGSEVVLSVRRSPDRAEETRIVCDATTKRLSIDRSRSSLNKDAGHDERGAALELPKTGRLDLHVFLDHSVVEVFGNRRVCLTSRIYPTRPDSIGVALSTTGKATAQSLRAWPLKPIS